MQFQCENIDYERIADIWRAYHKQLTGSDYIGYDEHGNVFGFIAKTRPNFQTEILHIMYEAGYYAGAQQANRMLKILEEVSA